MRGNWRLGDGYSYIKNLGFSAFAWEFLRRNADYRAAYRASAGKDDEALVVQRWGCVAYCAADPDLRADHVEIMWLPAKS